MDIVIVTSITTLFAVYLGSKLSSSNERVNYRRDRLEQLALSYGELDKSIFKHCTLAIKFLTDGSLHEKDMEVLLNTIDQKAYIIM